MIFAAVDSLKKRKAAEVLVIPFWKEKKTAACACEMVAISAMDAPLKTHDFKGKEGEVLFVYPEKQPETRVALLGLGDKKKITVEKLRRSYSSLAKECQQWNLKTANIALPLVDGLGPEDVVRGVVEGIALTNYAYEKLKVDSIKEEPTQLLTKVNLIGCAKEGLSVAKHCSGIVEGVCFARDLVNGNADDVTPQTLSETARAFAKQFKEVKTTVFDKSRIEKEKMGLLLAVNRGSQRDPAFIIMEYKGDPKSKDRTVVVGKGITYDTGGLNLKPTGSMETMKCDMSGAAAAFGTIYAAATIGLKKNIVAVVPSTENGIDANSYKPGDVYVSYSGKTVEIGNTDAEGRLILADALSYVCKELKPSRIVDLATLTGACVIALGEETTALMSNDDDLAERLTRAGLATYERVWRLPLFEEYKKQLKSDVADIKNTGGRAAGTITAGFFLKEFVDETPWAHLDIAGTAFLPKARRYHPQNGTGIGVRLLIEFLEKLP